MNPLDKTKRSVAYGGCGVKRDLIHVGILREHVRRHDVKRLVAFGEERIDERREALFEVNDDGGVVGSVDGLHHIITMARDDIVGWIHDGLPRPADVLARQRYAIAPADVATQVVDDPQTVRADTAVVGAGHCENKNWHRRAMLVC